MAAVEALIAELERAFESGASATPFRVGIEAIRTAPPLDASRLMAVLASHVDAAVDALSGPARQRLRAALPPRPVDRLDAANHDRLVAALSRSTPAITAGQVNALLAASGRYLAGAPLGALYQLIVVKDDHGGGAPLKHHAQDDTSLMAGFVAGSDAARSWLLSQLTEHDGLVERLVYGFNFRGDVPSLRIDAVGESLGLAAAIGSLSAVLELPVPEHTAFTGRIDARGRLYRVSDVEAKLRAATDSAVTNVYLPDDCGVTSHSSVKVHPCLHLRDAVAEIFPSEEVTRRLRAIRSARPALMPVRHWQSGPPDTRPRALITMVGGSDPIGTWKTRDGTATTTQEDGPILAACRELQPARVHLFYTTAPGPNDYSSKATTVKEAIERLYRDCTVITHPLPPDVADPTDTEALYFALSEAAAPVAAGLGSAYATFLNLSSGTGQMQVILALLYTTGVFHGTMIQVRESRWAQMDGQPRIRRVVLPSPRLDPAAEVRVHSASK